MLRRASPLTIASLLAVLLLPASALATDEPGMVGALDEPAITSRAEDEPVLVDAPLLWARIGGGMSSLVVDPDVNTGVTATIAFGVRIYSRIGLEVQVSGAYNTFGGEIGEIGTVAFGGGSVSIVPQVEVTRPGAPLGFILDAGLGFYYTAAMIQESSWSLGISAGMALEWRLLRWLALGVRARYHLFNLSVIGGAELIDVKSLQAVGVVDRLEVPFYVALSY